MVDDRNERGAEGVLVLAVRVDGASRASEVERLLTEAGATKVDLIERGGSAMTAGVSSASWTGG